LDAVVTEYLQFNYKRSYTGIRRACECGSAWDGCSRGSVPADLLQI